ncbi:hypothetical protein EJ08DRAFT_656557 [Tothia fuscella]|uniref:Uncharacterized protein n=1 Tax=Tothia fuscella TaxID=1048955 RepID=A0A9P4U428_9PEZI|nr:hypothetical protein EJ08DRAFT_656557 [Tothia fuscella]
MAAPNPGNQSSNEAEPVANLPQASLHDFFPSDSVHGSQPLSPSTPKRRQGQPSLNPAYPEPKWEEEDTDGDDEPHTPEEPPKKPFSMPLKIITSSGWTAYTAVVPSEPRGEKRKLEVVNEPQNPISKRQSPAKKKSSSSEESDEAKSARATKYTAREKEYLNAVFRDKLEHPKYTFEYVVAAFRYVFGDNPPRSASGMAHLMRKMEDAGELEGEIPDYFQKLFGVDEGRVKA